MDAWSCLEKIQRSENVISSLMLERVKAENVSQQNIEQLFNPFFPRLFYHLKLHRQVAEH